MARRALVPTCLLLAAVLLGSLAAAGPALAARFVDYIVRVAQGGAKRLAA